MSCLKIGHGPLSNPEASQNTLSIFIHRKKIIIDLNINWLTFKMASFGKFRRYIYSQSFALIYKIMYKLIVGREAPLSKESMA
jgi:hypothetical protein